MWNRVEDGLPPAGSQCIATVEYEGRRVSNEVWYDGGWSIPKGFKVVAWMLMPEPYEEDRKKGARA